METTTLHVEKVKILSRLVKDNAISLEEALLLLQNEEKVEAPPVPYTGSSMQGYDISPYLSVGTSTIPLSGTFSVTGGSNTFSTTTTSNGSDQTFLKDLIKESKDANI